jgi:transcriptional regulator with XRE-family HTH domain
MTTGQLSAFLRARRDSLAPEAVGIQAVGTRRVPGLRREELAMLAGVSVTYYTRLEQGQAHNASPSVLDALATALRLDEDERAHLHSLARASAGLSGRRRPVRAQPASAITRQLLDAMPGAAAVVTGPVMDVVAWNPLGHALLAGHLDSDARPNLLRMLFLDPRTRALYRDWADEARLAVSSLRFLSADRPDDGALSELVSELSTKSAEFTDLWARHPVVRCTSGIKRFDHPVVGAFELDFQVLHVADRTGQRLIAHTAAPGSTAATALIRLTSRRAAAVTPLLRRAG